MKLREVLPTLLLGLLGIAAAGAIALGASSITDEEIGLTAEPVSVGENGDRLVEPDDRSAKKVEGSSEEDVLAGDELSSGDGGGGDGGGTGSSVTGGGGSGNIETVEPNDKLEGSNSGSGSDSSGSGSGGSGTSGSGGNSGPGGGDD